MTTQKWTSDEDKAYHTICDALAAEGYFLDDEVEDAILRVAAMVAGHPASDSGWVEEVSVTQVPPP